MSVMCVYMYMYLKLSIYTYIYTCICLCLCIIYFMSKYTFSLVQYAFTDLLLYL